MQQVKSEQAPRFGWLRTLGAWALVPGLGVPITKVVENYYNVSFFSPVVSGMLSAVSEVGGWLGRSLSVPMWALVGILISALLIAGAVYWMVSDADARLSALATELSTAKAKLDELLNPKIVTLTESQQAVLSAIAFEENNDDGSYISSLPTLVGLQKLVVDSALDVLIKNSMVDIYQSGFGAKVGLAAAGREYVLHPDSPVNWVTKYHD
jgi:hypothetical protein